MKAQVGVRKTRSLPALAARAESAMSQLRGRAIGKRRSSVEERKLVREAIEVYIESLVAHGDPIPGPVEIERVTVSM